MIPRPHCPGLSHMPSLNQPLEGKEAKWTDTHQENPWDEQEGLSSQITFQRGTHVKNWGQQRKKRTRHQQHLTWRAIAAGKGSTISLWQREFSKGSRGYDIQAQTWMIKKKKKQQLFKRLYKRASQAQDDCWLEQGWYSEPSGFKPVWSSPPKLPYWMCPWSFTNCHLFLWPLPKVFTSSGADMSPCLIQPLLPNDSGTLLILLVYTD